MNRVSGTMISIFLCWSFSLAQPVKLAWSSNSEANLAGYNVYRSDNPGSGYARVNNSLILAPFYSDATARSDRTYYYVVTAVHLTGAESGFSSPIEKRASSLAGDGVIIVSAGADIVVRSGQAVVVTGHCSDMDTALSFSWAQLGGPRVYLDAADAVASFLAPSVSSDTDLQFRLTATDLRGRRASDDVTVTVKKVGTN